ncbi:CRISPR-associated helicase Cas3' [Rhizohabitans arisaemae]|uniref:CRISPR-associated helicase Cas3' n=1 Tax=Rhizohabitans arisaemae TaxID=2720610 RepID=UPI0024B176A3|nr:CRISPR-associated helicase Cas3' [Rhizohabitans arisaemae]
MAFDDDIIVRRLLAALWGKSRKYAGGTMNLLLSHMLDTAAVAERIWDDYLAPATRNLLDEISGGQGRRFFAWLCGIHDCGKATPAFQRVDDEGAARVRAAGLSWDEASVKRARWRHDKAGGALLIRLLGGVWADEQTAWVWPLVAGHHGTFPSIDLAHRRMSRGEPQGRGPGWARAQQAVVETFTRFLGYESLAAVQPVKVPSRAQQLQLSGFVVMADWIASDQEHFPGIDDLSVLSAEVARGRAAAAWAKLGLRGGWGPLEVPSPQVFASRFGQPPRPSQKQVLEMALGMQAPGIMIVEAPMGEGKTKGALIAGEIFAARFGFSGVFVGMPTQATCDPMFSQVRKWLAPYGDLADQVTLLHGKRRFNKEWKQLLGESAEESFDDTYGGIEEDDLYGEVACFTESTEPERQGPSEWFLKKSRGLLSPFVVGTIDQLLYAATRTKHVMLRAAGLMGKVVILDEVHAADIYMSQFLLEGLRWLGQARVPVILLSATLPAAQRRTLIAAYLAGAASREEVGTVGLPEPKGYPSVTTACLVDGEPVYQVAHTRTWRPDLPVKVTVFPEACPPARQDDADAEQSETIADRRLAEFLVERLAEGGCVLVIRNSVIRAQQTYQAMKARFGDDTRLLHGRLDAEDRAGQTEKCLALLGPPGENAPSRPYRLVLVATAVAEQSFDVDVDLLISDLTSIDLLLQRIGRMHRHAGVTRPAGLRLPEVVVTGFDPGSSEELWIEPHSEAVYGRYLLIRTAALIGDAVADPWMIPATVPALVEAVYGGGPCSVPPCWEAAEHRARTAWENDQRDRAGKAQQYLLTRAGEHELTTLEGLHYGSAQRALSEDGLAAAVRDGDPSVEVVMVSLTEHGYRTLGGRFLGINGEASADLLEEVLGGTVRLPSKLTRAAESELGPLEGWRSHGWLQHCRALVLDAEGTAKLGGYVIRYDSHLGLVVEGNGSPRYERGAYRRSR